MAKTVAAYLPFAEMLAHKRLRSLGRHIDQGIVISADSEGLLNAIEPYSPGMSSFRTCARLRIEYSITDSLRNADHLSRVTLARFKQQTVAVDALTQQGQRPVTDDD